MISCTVHICQHEKLPFCPNNYDLPVLTTHEQLKFWSRTLSSPIIFISNSSCPACSPGRSPCPSASPRWWRRPRTRSRRSGSGRRTAGGGLWKKSTHKVHIYWREFSCFACTISSMFLSFVAAYIPVHVQVASDIMIFAIKAWHWNKSWANFQSKSILRWKTPNPLPLPLISALLRQHV